MRRMTSVLLRSKVFYRRIVLLHFKCVGANEYLQEHVLPLNILKIVRQTLRYSPFILAEIAT